MKYTLTIIALALLFSACHKDGNSNSSSNSTSSNSFKQDASAVGLEMEHVYTAISEFNGVSRLIFHSNGLVSEYGDFGDSVTFRFSYAVRNNFSTQVLQGGKGMQIVIDSPYVSSKSCDICISLWNIQSMGAPWDSITFGTFVSGPVVQNSSPTIGMVNYTGAKVAYFIY